jgi:hypothetical protein
VASRGGADGYQLKAQFYLAENLFSGLVRTLQYCTLHRVDSINPLDAN